MVYAKLAQINLYWFKKNYPNDELDIYILGVTHWGTSWGYVLTDLELVKDSDDGYFKAIYEKEDV